MEPLITAAEIVKTLGINKRTLLRWIKAGKFPKPSIRVNRTARWRAGDLVSHI